MKVPCLGEYGRVQRAYPSFAFVVLEPPIRVCVCVWWVSVFVCLRIFLCVCVCLLFDRRLRACVCNIATGRRGCKNERLFPHVLGDVCRRCLTSFHGSKLAKVAQVPHCGISYCRFVQHP